MKLNQAGVATFLLLVLCRGCLGRATVLLREANTSLQLPPTPPTFGFEPRTLSVPTLTPQGIGLRFTRLPNRGGEIRLQQAASLSGPWQPLEGNLPNPILSFPGGQRGQIDLGPPADDAGYYRALLLDP